MHFSLIFAVDWVPGVDSNGATVITAPTRNQQAFAVRRKQQLASQVGIWIGPAQAAYRITGLRIPNLNRVISTVETGGNERAIGRKCQFTARALVTKHLEFLWFLTALPFPQQKL